MTLTLAVLIITTPLFIRRQITSINTISNLFFLGLLNEKITLNISANKIGHIKNNLEL